MKSKEIDEQGNVSIVVHVRNDPRGSLNKEITLLLSWFYVNKTDAYGEPRIFVCVFFPRLIWNSA